MRGVGIWRSMGGGGGMRDTSLPYNCRLPPPSPSLGPSPIDRFCSPPHATPYPVTRPR